MADTKISALTKMTGTNIANVDTLVIVDNNAGETKGVTVANLADALADAFDDIAMTATNVAAGDELLISDGGAAKGITSQELAEAWFNLFTNMTGSNVASADEFIINDNGTAKAITQANALAGFFNVAAAMTGSNVTTNADNLLINDGGTVKDITVDGLFNSKTQSGWGAPTGTATRTTFATRSAGTYTTAGDITAAAIQAIDDHLQVLSERMHAVIDDLTTIGLLSS